jgi:hypothetical protein
VSRSQDLKFFSTTFNFQLKAIRSVPVSILTLTKSQTSQRKKSLEIGSILYSLRELLYSSNRLFSFSFSEYFSSFQKLSILQPSEATQFFP